MTNDCQDPDRASTRSASGCDLTGLPEAEREERAALLTEEQRHVLIERGTEPPFSGSLLHCDEEGAYFCRLCRLPLFESDAKYESGTGWPSFYEPIDPAHLRSFPDTSDGMERTELRCARCDAHLGHVFLDGPPPGGLRYCINSAALTFETTEERVEADVTAARDAE